MKKIILSLTSYLLPLICLAAIPAGYYADANGKKGDAICAALHKKIKDHTSLGYDNLYSMYQTSDLTAQGYIWDMYSTCNFANPGDKCGSYKRVCDCFNREHSVPASWFGDANPMYCDPFHVIPTDGYVNNQRSNYPLGECANGTRLSGGSLCKLGTSTLEGYTSAGKVFEVDDQYKGDFARAYFYMVTCYRDKNFTKAGGGTTMFTWSNSTAGFTAYTIALMLKWHRQDPVSDKEISRNNAIYARQGNRNPFIDYPCLAEYIWGEYKNESLDLSQLMATDNEDFPDSDHTGCSCHSDDPTLLTPKKASTLSLGSASVGESVSLDVYVSGSLLTQPLSCTLSGTNADMFALSANSLAATTVNNGTTIKITYQPTTTGSHTATLSFSSSEVTDYTLTLTGESKAELVTPATGTEVVFFAEGVKDTIIKQITVKGTNLTKNIYVGVSTSASASKNFSVTPSSLTAAQVNEGTTVTVTYIPTAITSEQSMLILNSQGGEFTQPSVKLSGYCAFVLQDPTDITHQSATLNWVNAGKNKYMVDVFILKSVEEKEVVILDDNAGSNATSKSATYTDVTGYIRLGSGSMLGSISYANLDLSKSSTMTVVARAYKSDTDVRFKVSIDTMDTTLSLSSSDQTFTFSLPAGSATSTVMLSSVDKGKRVLIKNIKIISGGTKEEREHVNGYPREEIYLFHTVHGLLPETEYSYTITPDGLPESNKATFTTLESPSNLDESFSDSSAGCTKFISPDGHLLLHHVGHLYNVLGQPLTR